MHSRNAGEQSAGRPPVVCVHGLVVSSRYFRPTVDLLAADFDVRAPDMPGFGLSSNPPKALDVRELADVLGDWLEVEGVERPILVANSFGCQYAVALMARASERFGGLVLIGPTTDASTPTWTRQGWRWVNNVYREPPQLNLVIARDLVDHGVRRGFTTAHHSLNDRIEEKLVDVAVPTIVMRGGWDPIAPQRWSEQVARLVPTATLDTVPRRGHVLNYNSPERVAAAVRSLASG